MKKPIKITDEVFRREFLVFFDWSEQQFSKYLKSKYNVYVEGISGYNGVCTQIDLEDKSYIIIYVMSHNIVEMLHALDHECTHATNFVFSDAGFKLDANNDECQAYYQAMIFRLTLERLSKKYFNPAFLKNP